MAGRNPSLGFHTIPKGHGQDDAVNRNPGKRDKIRVYPDRAGEIRWKRLRPNGRVISESGEGYKERRHALEGMKMANPDWDQPHVHLVDLTDTETTDE